jgi:hypothetical protein
MSATIFSKSIENPIIQLKKVHPGHECETIEIVEEDGSQTYLNFLSRRELVGFVKLLQYAVGADELANDDIKVSIVEVGAKEQ